MSELTTHRLAFRALDVGDGSDGRFAAAFQGSWLDDSEYAAGEPRSPGEAARARRTFATHMPELVPVLDRLLAQAGGHPDAETLLTGVGMKPFWQGCTVAGTPGTLLRNYDFPVGQCDRTVVRSHFLRPVIGMGDVLWGMLDGMNDAGLAVALTFGGRWVSGPGFSVLVVIRYLLETCDTVEQALATLDRLPAFLAQNLVLTDPEQAVTVYLGPDLDRPIRAAATAPGLACAANHQHLPVPEQQERESRTHARLNAVAHAAADGTAATLDALLCPPVYADAFAEGYGTLYTAAYHPGEGRVTYHWPGGQTWRQSFAAFATGERTVTVGQSHGSPPSP